MANYGLLSGLGTAMSDFGKIGLKEWADNEDELRDARKLQLKNKLDMDLMKAKYDFMKANPRYKQFFTDPSGNRIGVDEQGHEALVHKATAEEAADAKAKRQAEIDYRKALAAAATGRSEVTDSTIEKNKALTEAARARAGRDRRYQPGAGKKDDSILAPVQWDNAVEAEVKRNMSKEDYDDPDTDKSEARAKAADKLRAAGYTRGFQNAGAGGGGGLGAFANAPGLSGGGAGGGLLSVGGEDDEMQDHGPDDDDDLDDE